MSVDEFVDRAPPNLKTASAWRSLEAAIGRWSFMSVP